MAQRKVILRAIFFCPFRLALVPTICPGSLRMISVQPIDLLCIYVSEITACIINIWGCTEILLPFVHIWDVLQRPRKQWFWMLSQLQPVLFTKCWNSWFVLHMTLWHDLEFSQQQNNALSLSVQGYTFTNTYLVRVRDCKWRNCIKIY